MNSFNVYLYDILNDGLYGSCTSAEDEVVDGGNQNIVFSVSPAEVRSKTSVLHSMSDMFLQVEENYFQYLI
jgi:hypothetical protein